MGHYRQALPVLHSPLCSGAAAGAGNRISLCKGSARAMRLVDHHDLQGQLSAIAISPAWFSDAHRASQSGAVEGPRPSVATRRMADACIRQGRAGDGRCRRSWLGLCPSAGRGRGDRFCVRHPVHADGSARRQAPTCSMISALPMTGSGSWRTWSSGMVGLMSSSIARV